LEYTFMAEQFLSVTDLMAEFLQSQPLYVRKHFDLPRYANVLYPQRIFLNCSQCGAERPFKDRRPWNGTGVTVPPPLLKNGVISFYFQCIFCTAENVAFWVEVNCTEGWIRKVGQRPPWNIAIRGDIAANLGSDADLYKRAKTCLSQGLGLGACVYLRRVLENQVDNILNLLLVLKKQTGSPAGELTELEALLGDKRTDEKLLRAHKFLPHSLMVEETNPLKVIYDMLNVGMHTLTEEECTQVALKAAACFEYIVFELSHQIASRQQFMEEMEALSSVRSKLESDE